MDMERKTQDTMLRVATALLDSEMILKSGEKTREEK